MSRKAVAYTTKSTRANPGQFREVLPLDSTRDALAIQNKGTESVFLNLGPLSKATTLTSIKLAPGATFEPLSAPINGVNIAGDNINTGPVELVMIYDNPSVSYRSSIDGYRIFESADLTADLFYSSKVYSGSQFLQNINTNVQYIWSDASDVAHFILETTNGDNVATSVDFNAATAGKSIACIVSRADFTNSIFGPYIIATDGSVYKVDIDTNFLPDIFVYLTLISTLPINPRKGYTAAVTSGSNMLVVVDGNDERIAFTTNVLWTSGTNITAGSFSGAFNRLGFSGIIAPNVNEVIFVEKSGGVVGSATVIEATAPTGFQFTMAASTPLGSNPDPVLADDQYPSFSSHFYDGTNVYNVDGATGASSLVHTSAGTGYFQASGFYAKNSNGEDELDIAYNSAFTQVGSLFFNQPFTSAVVATAGSGGIAVVGTEDATPNIVNKVYFFNK